MQNPFDRTCGCCFTGHRPTALPDAGNERKPGMRALCLLLERAVERAVSDGFTAFYTGGALGFDTLAAEAVLRPRRRRQRGAFRLFHEARQVSAAGG